MRPQNVVEGALPLLAVVLMLSTGLLSQEAAFITAIACFVLLSVYLFVRRDWEG